MADNQDGLKVKFGAEIGELLSKLTQAKDKVGETTDSMSAKLAGLSKGFLALTAGLAALATAAAGGALKGMIDETNQANVDTQKFARTLGITAEVAGGMSEALDDVGMTQEEYLGVFQKFSRQLKNNEENLKSYGIVTRDTNGNLRDTATLIREAGAITETYKQGVDRNIVSMELFGRSGADLSKVMKVTEEAIQANIAKNRELNLTLTQEGVAATKAYKLAMKDVDDVITGVRRTIATAFTPGFTAMAEMFNSFGPIIVQFTEVFVGGFIAIKTTVINTIGSVVSLVFGMVKSVVSVIAGAFRPGGEAITPLEFFANVVRIIEVVFISLRVAVEFVVEVIKTALIALGSIAATTGEVISKALSGDFKGAKERWKQGFADLAGIAKDGMANVAKIAAKGKEDIDNSLNKNFNAKGTAQGLVGTQGTKGAPEKAADENAANRVALAKAQADAELNLTKEYLKQANAAYEDAYKNNLIELKDFYAAKLAIELKGIDDTIEAKKKEQQAIKDQGSGKNAQDSLKLQAQMAKVTGELQVLEAQRYGAVVANARAAANAERELARALEETRIAGRQSAGLAEIEAGKATAADRLANLEITKQQELQIQRDLERQKLDILLRGLAERRDNANGDLKVLEQIAEQKVEIERQSAAAIIAIDRAMNLERRSAAQSVTGSIQSSLAGLFESVATGSKSLSDALKDFVNSITATISKLAANRLAESLFSGGSSGGGGGFGSMLTSFFGSIFGGGKASGGPVNSGTPYMVGERGPEMFVPKSSGTIIPNGGGGMMVTNNFTVSGAADMRTQQQIAAAAGRGIRRASMRNS